MRKLERRLRHQIDHLLDRGTWRADAHRREQFPDGVLAAGSGNLEVAAGQVADPPRQLKRSCLLLDKVSKADPLDFPGDFDVNDRHEVRAALRSG